MSIKRNGSQASIKGPADTFTGNVRIDPLFQSPGPAQFGGASVSFEPGARSAWHTHPCGQTLIVTAGLGWTQCLWMSADRVLLAANDVLNRKFTPLVDDGRKVCAGNQQLIYSDGLRFVSERIDSGASK